MKELFVKALKELGLELAGLLGNKMVTLAKAAQIENAKKSFIVKDTEGNTLFQVKENGETIIGGTLEVTETQIPASFHGPITEGKTSPNAK